MATTSQSVSAKEVEKPLVATRGLIGGIGGLTLLYSWVRWYEGVYGWSAGLDAFAPEFETYWMNFLYTEILVEVLVAAALWGYLWRTRPKDLSKLTPREELRNGFTLIVWLCCYAWAVYWGASYFTEQDGTWHQTIVRDTDFTPSHIVEFYGAYPVYIIIGFASYIYAHTRLPYFDYSKRGLSLAFTLFVIGPFMIVPNVGLNEWGHTFWFMEELFVAPLHYGFVFFGWFTLGVLGVLLQSLACFANLIGKELCGDVYDQAVARVGADQATWMD